MNKEEYMSKLEALTAKRDELNKEIVELRKEYINSVSKIPVNTKVIVNNAKHKNEVGILIGYRMVFDEVFPNVAVIKKNGEPHPHRRLSVYSESELTPVKE